MKNSISSKINSAIYTSFASVYDATMKKVPYLQWADFVFTIFSRYGIASTDRILDAGCGTGSLMKLLQTAYPHITGLDISLHMLQKAFLKKCRKLVNADLLQMPFPDKSFSAILCTHDVLNYICEELSVEHAFAEFNRVLESGGVLLFDISTAENAVQNYHNKNFHEKHSNIAFDWYNTYDDETGILTSQLEFRTRGAGIRKELHLQKMYPTRQIETLMISAGFSKENIYADYTMSETLTHAQLLTFVARKH